MQSATGVLGSLPASMPSVRRPERIVPSHRFLDTTQPFVVIPFQWFPAPANPTPAQFWNRQLHTANRVPAGLLQMKLAFLWLADGPAPLKLKAGSLPAPDSKLPPSRRARYFEGWALPEP